MLTAVCAGLVLVGVMVVSGAPGDPHRCCTDNQYSMTFGAVGEVLTDDAHDAQFIDGVFQVGYDYYNERQAILSRLRQPDGSVLVTYQIKDYTTRTLYERSNGTCTYKDLDHWDNLRPACIPADAIYLSSSVFGYGAHNITVNNWLFSMPLSDVTNSSFILAVTEKHCVPVAETIVGMFNDVKIEESLFFTNYHPGLENINMLDIPDNCTAAAS